MNTWLKFIFLALFSCVFISCSPSTLEPAPTKSILPSSTPSLLEIPATTALATGIPGQKITPAVNTETPTATITLDWSKLPNLAKAILKPDDISPDKSVTFSWILRDKVSITDATKEMGYECLLDCAKLIWDTFDNQITVFLMRAGSHEKANRTVLQLYDEIGPPDYDYQELLIPYLDNGWAIATQDCRYLNARCHFVTSSRYGSVVVLVFSNHVRGSDDAVSEMLVSIEIASAQVEKLKSLGFPP